MYSKFIRYADWMKILAELNELEIIIQIIFMLMIEKLPRALYSFEKLNYLNSKKLLDIYSENKLV